MSFQRVTEWRCDFCEAGVTVGTYGLPDGWFWVHKTGEPLQHSCPACSHLFNDREKGRSGSWKVVADE